VRRGNPKPSVAIDLRAQRPFEARIQFPLNDSTIAETAERVYSSPSIETHGFTGANVFVNLGISWPGVFTPRFALVGYLVQGMGTTGSPGPPSIISNGIAGFGGKAVVNPGTYPLPLVVGGTGDRRHVHADHAWFELWAVGRGAFAPFPLDVAIDGMIVTGWSYS